MWGIFTLRPCLTSSLYLAAKMHQPGASKLIVSKHQAVLQIYIYVDNMRTQDRDRASVLVIDININ